MIGACSTHLKPRRSRSILYSLDEAQKRESGLGGTLHRYDKASQQIALSEEKARLLRRFSDPRGMRVVGLLPCL